MNSLDDRLRARLAAIEVDGPALGIVHQRVLREASQRRGRRRLRWLGGALAVLAVPGGVGAVGYATRGGDDVRVDVVRPRPDPDSVTVLPDPGPTDPSPDEAISERPSGAPSPATTAPAPSRHPSTDGSAASAAAAPSGGADAGAAPSAAVAAVTEEEGCDVQGYDDRSVYLPNGGAGAGAPPSCVYEATRPGGYVAQGSWIIEIERGGFRRTLSAQAGDRACGEVGVIRPGDVVRATVRGGVESSGDPGSVRVGTRWSC